MISAIQKLEPKLRKPVFSQLKIRGNCSKNGQYCRYGFRELQNFASILNDSHTLSPEGLNRFLRDLNKKELDLIERLQKGESESIQAIVRSECNRTRLAVRRIVSKIEKDSSNKHSGLFSRLKSAWSHHPTRS